jgi:hypothetical protein
LDVPENWGYFDHKQKTAYLKDLSKRIEWTYKCRLEASKRIRSADVASSSALVFFNLASVLSAISSLLGEETDNISGRPEISILLAMLALGVGLLTATASYGRRAQLMYQNYLGLKDLWSRCEILYRGGFSSTKDLVSLSLKYHDLLEGHENHYWTDYRLLTEAKNEPRLDLNLLSGMKDPDGDLTPWKQLTTWVKYWGSTAFLFNPRRAVVYLISRRVWILPAIAFGSFAGVLIEGYLL